MLRQSCLRIRFQVPSHWKGNMIVLISFLVIMNQLEFRLVYNQSEICQYDHIPFYLEGPLNVILFVYTENFFRNLI